MPFELRRDMGTNAEPDRRYVGPDRGRDNDRRNISAHDRLGRVRNSVGEFPLVVILLSSLFPFLNFLFIPAIRLQSCHWTAIKNNKRDINTTRYIFLSLK